MADGAAQPQLFLTAVQTCDAGKGAPAATHGIDGRDPEGWHISNPPPHSEDAGSASHPTGWQLSSTQPTAPSALIPSSTPATADRSPSKDSQAARDSAANRVLKRSGSSICSCSTLILWFFGLWFSYSFYELYVAFSPELCDLSKETAHMPGRARCILPLFSKGQNVDVYIFASAAASLQTSAATSLTPFWNATNLSVSAPSSFGGRGLSGGVWRAAVPVPATVWENNGSYFAHVAIVKQGGSPFPSAHTPVRVAGGGVAFENLVLYSAALTYHMKAARRHNVSAREDARGRGAGWAGGWEDETV